MNNVKKGFFIVVEGIEGAGKSSCLNLIDQILAEHNYSNIIHTREPGGTKLAEKIRELLLKKDDENLTEEAELLLMYASRAQLVNTVIKPSLDAGSIVVGDRHDLSSIAYQGGGRGMNIKTIKDLKTIVIGNFKPNITILLDVEPSVGLSRVDNRGQGRDRFESEKISFFERVRTQYLKEAQNDSSIKVIDANQSLDEVNNSIRSVMEEFLCSLG